VLEVAGLGEQRVEVPERQLALLVQLLAEGQVRVVDYEFGEEVEEVGGQLFVLLQTDTHTGHAIIQIIIISMAI
jgi:hypothetical protein